MKRRYVTECFGALQDLSIQAVNDALCRALAKEFNLAPLHSDPANIKNYRDPKYAFTEEENTTQRFKYLRLVGETEVTTILFSFEFAVLDGAFAFNVVSDVKSSWRNQSPALSNFQHAVTAMATRVLNELLVNDESVKDYHLYYIDDVSFVVTTEPNINPVYEHSECSWSEPGLSFHRTLNNAPEIRIKIDITVKDKVDRSANHYVLMRHKEVIHLSMENKHR